MSGERMSHLNFGGSSGVVIDSCGTHGVWLQSTELRQLMEWWRAGEGGNCLIYITTLKQDGNPKWGQQVVVEHGPQDVLYTDPKPGEPHGVDYRMNSTLNSYIVYVGGDLPSDRVTGLGMGEWLGGMDHTTFVLVFQLARK
jgi:hypothetical protein